MSVYYLQKTCEKSSYTSINSLFLLHFNSYCYLAFTTLCQIQHKGHNHRPCCSTLPLLLTGVKRGWEARWRPYQGAQTGMPWHNILTYIGRDYFLARKATALPLWRRKDEAHIGPLPSTKHPPPPPTGFLHVPWPTQPSPFHAPLKSTMDLIHHL